MKKPNPGSDEAVEAGCSCPRMDNGHGKGSMWGPGTYWINGDCPIHGKKEEPTTGNMVVEKVHRGT